jgi:LysR family glycine cleavage system transcriptional activator
MNRQPPLKALPAFDAAMRSNSFSIAASELHVTPGAVGQQIRKLEHWLGVRLFSRQVRQVIPTAEAIAYWKRVQPALAQIADASRGLRESRRTSVRLSMPPSFAAKWFTRRMANFITSHPEIELQLSSSVAPVDFEREDFDLAVRYFDGKDAQLDASLLARDEARVYASPAYLAQHRLRRPDDLVRATLLHTTILPLWPQWLERFGKLSASRIAAIPGVHFDQGLMAIEAARQGQGLVMASPLLTEDEVARGDLVEPFGHRIAVSGAYYVVHPRRARLRPAAGYLKEWLLDEAGKTGIS